ncbi:MAG: putative rane protein [Gaiellaceae bacterium]|nr:putative rane protein [Gaiellaceae bacterium]
MIAHAFSGGSLWSSWTFQPVPLALGAAAVVLFGQAFVRLRRRGRADLAPSSRALLWALGVALSLLGLVSPLDRIAEERLLAGHMLQHMLLADLGPALMLLAIRGPLTFFLLPPPVLRRVAGFRPLRAFLHRLTGPWVVLALYSGTMIAWHVPRLYDYALTHQPVHDLEHALFAFTGILVWLVLVDPARTGRLSGAKRILFGVGVLAAMHAIVDPLLFSGHPLYPYYARISDRLWGISPLVDQRLAAVIMFVEQLATVGTCVAVLLRPYLRRARTAAVPAQG